MQELTATPAQKMVLALNITHPQRGSIYEGTASTKATAKRRAKNKTAKASRKANR